MEVSAGNFQGGCDCPGGEFYAGGTYHGEIFVEEFSMAKEANSSGLLRK